MLDTLLKYLTIKRDITTCLHQILYSFFIETIDVYMFSFRGSTLTILTTCVFKIITEKLYRYKLNFVELANLPCDNL